MSKITFPLYHGTDLNTYYLNKDQRNEYKNSAMVIISFFIKLYDINDYRFKNSAPGRELEEKEHYMFLEKKLGAELKSKVSTYLGKAQCIGSALYQYNDFYITGVKGFALNYAQNAHYFGEIGTIAYYLVKGAEVLQYKYELPDDVILAMNKMKELWDKEPNPIIIKFENIDIENLLDHSGNEIKENLVHEGGSYRFKNNIPELTSDMIIRVN